MNNVSTNQTKYKPKFIDTTLETLDSINNTGFASFNEQVRAMPDKLTDSKEYNFAKENGDSRMDLFTKTVKNCTKGGALFGASTGLVATSPLDMFVGYGVDETCSSLGCRDVGALGYTAVSTSIAVSAAVDVAGMAVGVAAGAASLPASLAFEDVSPKQWIRKSAFSTGGKASKWIARIITTPSALALNVARGCSAVTKMIAATACAVVGGSTGAVAGLFRAAINK